jgi:hypothetical protein
MMYVLIFAVICVTSVCASDEKIKSGVDENARRGLTAHSGVAKIVKKTGDEEDIEELSALFNEKTRVRGQGVLTLYNGRCAPAVPKKSRNPERFSRLNQAKVRAMNLNLAQQFASLQITENPIAESSIIDQWTSKPPAGVLIPIPRIPQKTVFTTRLFNNTNGESM